VADAAGSPPEVVRSLLAPVAVARLVERDYDVPRPVECELAQSGFNDNYYVRAGADRAPSVVRIYRRGSYWLRDEASYRFELEWVYYVHGRGAPVAAPLPRRDGDLLGTVDAPEGSRYVARFAFAEGAFGDLMPAGARALGIAHARLHEASAGFRSTRPRLTVNAGFTLREPAARIERFLGETGQDRAAGVGFLRETVDRAGRAFDRIPRDDRTWGVVGGDCHHGNQLSAPDGAVTLIDFELCGWGPYAYDCATLRWSLRGSGDERPALWAAYLDGYGTVRRLTDEEAAAIPWLAAARHVWLMGAHTTYAADAGTAWLGPGYWNHTFGRLRELVDDAADGGE
jgi:Ser/Thr protein kinase RdoA (MazF antagonist)